MVVIIFHPQTKARTIPGLGGGFEYFLFSPLFGEDFQFDEHIFQMGWLVQPPTSGFFISDIFPAQKRVITCYHWTTFKREKKPFENSSVDLRRSQGRSGLSITSKGASEDCRSRLVSGSMYGLHVRMSLWKGLVIGSMVIGSLG